MKLLFFDIDGTLYTRGKGRYLPQSTVDAIRATRQKGNLTFVNTGRVYCNIDKEIKDIGFDGYVCGCGTNVLLGDKVLHYQGLDSATSKKIADTIYDHGIDVIFERYDHLIFDERMLVHPEMAAALGRFKAGGSDTTHRVQDDDFSFDKCFGWYADKDKWAVLKEYLSGYFDVMNAGGNYYEVQPLGCSKATGILKVMEHLNVPLEDVYVFGDSPNDESMFDLCQNVICMGDSPDTYLFEKASFVTRAVHEDGIAYAMKTLGLTD